MPLTPPKALAPKDSLKQDPLSAALEHEVLAEKAATYSRLVDKLQKALEKLREFEAVLDITAHPSRRRSAPPQDEAMATQPSDKSRPHGEEDRRSVSNHVKSGNPEHEALLNAAGRALWYVMIQRDLCGFRRHELFYRELNVPTAVRLRMGISRSR